MRCDPYGQASYGLRLVPECHRSARTNHKNSQESYNAMWLLRENTCQISRIVTSRRKEDIELTIQRSKRVQLAGTRTSSPTAVTHFANVQTQSNILTWDVRPYGYRPQSTTHVREAPDGYKHECLHSSHKVRMSTEVLEAQSNTLTCCARS